jgi:imidazolonepropionase-like amidohydrolase
VRKIVALPLLALAACASPRASAPPAADLALVGVTVVDPRGGRLLPDRTVLIEGNRIRSVGPMARVRVPAGTRTVDATGKFVIPGLWDMHRT